MSASRRLSALLLALLAFSAGLAGCVTQRFDAEDDSRPDDPAPVDLLSSSVADGVARLAEMRREAMVLPVNVTIHVVLVGIDMDLVDVAAMREALPKDYSPEIDFSRERDGGLRSGLLHNLAYEFHEAPEEFASGLFSQYEAFSREENVPRGAGGSPGFLDRYDAMYELGRTNGGKMRLVDAEKVENWLHENRAEHGLSYDAPQYTLFFLDSWTKHQLWPDQYYWYEYVNDTRAGGDTKNMRTWGGTYDFMFMDYSAAPNPSSNDNVGVRKQDVCCGISVPASAPEGTAYNDPPMWHYEGDTARIGKGAYEKTVTLTERIQHAVDVAVNVRLIGDFAFRPVYKETYHVNVHLWHDGRSIIPSDNLDQMLDPNLLFPGLQAQIPWADVRGTITTYVAPRDDPGMDKAITRAKAEAAGANVAIAPIYQQIDGNSEKYRQNQPGVFDVMALLFIFEGHYTLFLPLIVGGLVFAGPDGTAWGAMSSVNDQQFISSGRDAEMPAKSLIGINAHELGHFFGLAHAHDGSRRTADGYEQFLDHTWSSSATVMSYRMRPVTTDTYHRDILARAHTLENLELTLRNAHSAYRALAARNVESTPGDVADLLETATDGFNRARLLHHRGLYEDAVVAAIEGRRAADQAMRLAGVVDREVVVEAWDATGVNSAGHKSSTPIGRPGVAPTGIKRDYREIPITDEVERVTVRATWTNAPTSWGDFFIGWINPANNFALPADLPVGIMPGIHDNADEGPLDGQIEEWFTLDMDAFPLFRDTGSLLMGAGTQGNAVNGAYHVEIVVVYRDHGDGKGPAAAAA